MKLRRVTKKRIYKADHAGSCYICGNPIYVGDKIYIVEVLPTAYAPPITKACHKECYP